ncbi:hypothetical protein [Tropicimonas isoalkanivorans]|uniref:Uncharacterized protein n=1 Tax=Tropicimonas isoalkanivorans TaxID=441112 RepID=A0A1I1JP01_9RHOB|nr:hypothetical protein [Tropicimonas isoalkanivorans]SFC50284.1 hypothetical protein SAMN04488094_105206 [Tropicimonas isoalkanivorans]
MTHSDIREALDLLKAGAFRRGRELDAAHQICQRHEGQPLFDWLHALVHRIEGDDGNADYWYRRASRSRHPGSAEEEWQEILNVVQGT